MCYLHWLVRSCGPAVTVNPDAAAVTLNPSPCIIGAGLVYRAMGFPPQFFTVLFAVPRVTGYLAHWRESLTDPDVKIARPQQIYLVRRPCCPTARS